MSREILLTQGAVTIVDDADYTWLNQCSWHLNSNGYAMRQMFLIHREILEAPPDMEVDHINRDRLDNRRANLRLCTHAQGPGTVESRLATTGSSATPGTRAYAGTREEVAGWHISIRTIYDTI